MRTCVTNFSFFPGNISSNFSWSCQPTFYEKLDSIEGWSSPPQTEDQPGISGHEQNFPGTTSVMAGGPAKMGLEFVTQFFCLQTWREHRRGGTKFRHSLFAVVEKAEKQSEVVTTVCMLLWQRPCEICRVWLSHNSGWDNEWSPGVWIIWQRRTDSLVGFLCVPRLSELTEGSWGLLRDLGSLKFNLVSKCSFTMHSCIQRAGLSIKSAVGSCIDETPQSAASLVVCDTRKHRYPV